MVSKSQYQHYVPQFILRKFSNYIAPDEASFPTRKAYDKAVYSAKKKAKVQIIEFSRGFSNGTLDQRRCNGTFGIVDMYTPEIETKLGKLEEKVSKVIRKIEEDFYNGRTETTLVRTDKDLLRKFIFIMLYRNAGFHERFDGGEEDYASNDRKSLLEYMHERGFTLPKEVWLSNIDAFIDVDMSGDRENWMRWLRKRAYPMDALWYIKNMTNSYLCFCTPNRADEELVLTQNAYGVHEGPGSISSWMDWHTFTPINPKLVIVLRNTALDRASTLQPFMPNHMAQEFGQKFMTFRNMITSQFRDPVEAQSWLQDMPVNRPVTKYASASHEGDPRVTKYLLGPTDLFTFKFFRLTSEFIQRINSVFLEEAVLTNTIVYKTSHALRKALEFYLTIEKKGLKTVFEDTSDKQSEVVTVHDGVMKPIRDVSVYHRRAYLDMLVCIASDLGSTRKLMLPLRSSGPLIALKPHMSSVFLRRYTNLGNAYSLSFNKD